MTVVYTHEVATENGFGNFSRLLFRWRGSIYKLVFPELIVYMLMYFTLSVIYRVGLRGREQGKKNFQNMSKYCADYGGVIPVSFVLGFFVSQIVTRWWSIYMTIPWPDNLAAITSISVIGHDERGRLMRRTIMRYVNLCFVFVCVMISPQVKARFPTLEHLVDAGFLLPHEKIILEHLDQKTDQPKYWIPIVWAGSIANRARKEKRIQDDLALLHLVQSLCEFRTLVATLLSYDWVCVPIVYTQVVTLAVYLYFAAGLFGKQFTNEEMLDLYFPLFLFLEFFFYMGWLKVAETLVNPFGEDDDDFEINWLIDRNFAISYFIVDEMNEEHPEMVRDQYWDEIVPEELPYTIAAEKFKTQPYMGSAAHSEVPDNQMEFRTGVSAADKTSLLASSLGNRASKFLGAASLGKKALSTAGHSIKASRSVSDLRPQHLHGITPENVEPEEEPNQFLTTRKPEPKHSFHMPRSSIADLMERKIVTYDPALDIYDRYQVESSANNKPVQTKSETAVQLSDSTLPTSPSSMTEQGHNVSGGEKKTSN